KLNREEAQKLLKLIDKFEDNDDVQEVYHNAEIDEADIEE
ncbi:MAG TPA: YebC/PmpR family DNA-binding transcriptional regulator, partial [Fibrobacter sp.]|nr:YebC/PmpR family DNA-binding transcriptional regulator [Fibrobacter sp.]